MTSPTPNSGAAHTPTPWIVETYSDKRTPVEIRTDRPLYPGASNSVLVAKLPHDTVNPRANAAFIVTACNNYDALLAANEALRDQIKAAQCAEQMTAANEALRKRVAKLEGALGECEVYFEDRMDVIDGPDGEPAPNREMALLTEVRDALYSHAKDPS